MNKNELLWKLPVVAVILSVMAMRGQTVEVRKEVASHHYATSGKVAVEWHFHDEYRVWLSVNTHNRGEWDSEGYHPSFTYVLTQYKPIVHKLPNGQWEINFTSEIAQDLP